MDAIGAPRKNMLSSPYRKRVFIVGFSRAYRRELAEALREEGYRVSLYQSFELAHYAMKLDSPETVLMDFRGETLDFIKSYGGLLPIFVLSERQALMEVVTVLREGAADYIRLPCYFPEILARIERNLPQQPIARPVTVGDICLDAASGMLKVESETLTLSKRESLILAALMRCPDNPVTRDKLMRVAGITNARTTIVESYIKTLRKCHPRLRQAIRTRYGGGYVFCA